MYFPIRRSLPARPEQDNTYWTASSNFPLTGKKGHTAIEVTVTFITSYLLCKTNVEITVIEIGLANTKSQSVLANLIFCDKYSNL